jgi:hypothetical protein
MAGWRRSHLPALPAEAYFTFAPDGVCEVLSPGTAAMDRTTKLPSMRAKASRTPGSSIRWRERWKSCASRTAAGPSWRRAQPATSSAPKTGLAADLAKGITRERRPVQDGLGIGGQPIGAGTAAGEGGPPAGN